MKKVLGLGAGVLIAFSAFVIFGNQASAEAVIYHSPGCGCCEIYEKYLESHGIKLKSVSGDVESIKNSLGIAENFRSCHTVIINGKFIEGHVPFEAIEKLLESDADGIALPGMPSGSPGMPGPKTEEFVIYSFKNGQVQEFMRI